MWPLAIDAGRSSGNPALSLLTLGSLWVLACGGGETVVDASASADSSVAPDSGDSGVASGPADTTSNDAAAASSGLPPAKQLFDPQGKHEVLISTAASDWAAILADAADQTRVRDYHVATLTIDGTVYAKVGIKNFGDGSQDVNPKKPNIRIKFNQYDEKLHGPEGVRNLRLKAAGDDPGYVREPLFYSMVASLGVAAARFSFARVQINGVGYGTYQVFEQADKQMPSASSGTPRASATRSSARATGSTALSPAVTR